LGNKLLSRVKSPFSPRQGLLRDVIDKIIGALKSQQVVHTVNSDLLNVVVENNSS